MDDNCGEWVKSMGVVSRRQVWLVGVGGIYGCGKQEGVWVESIGVASGCGGKEVYKFPHSTYP